jgi:hypothetical protein
VDSMEFMKALNAPVQTEGWLGTGLGLAEM